MRILFICTHNRCRSILAEVIGRHIGAGRLQTASAGSHPGAAVHPETLRHLQSRGYDTDGLHSKGLEAVKPFSPHVVITVCDSAANEPCPLWLSRDAVMAHWGLSDPSRATGDADAAFGGVITTLEKRLRQLLSHDPESLSPAQLSTLLNTLSESR